MTYIEWLEDKCLHILDESWVCDLMSEHADEWEYCSEHCENGKGECLRRLYTVERKTGPNCSEKPNNCKTCRYESLASYEGACDDCTDISGSPSNYAPKDCETCRFYHPDYEAIACERCLDGKYSRYEPRCSHTDCYYYDHYDADVCGRCTSKDEQTEREGE